MSAVSTPNDSPAHVQPLHNPSQAAHVVVPQAPLGNTTNNGQAPGMGAKALLAKKLAKSHNPAYISPTDNMMTPVSQKLNAAKKRHFIKGAKPMPSLFAQAQKELESDSDSEKSSDEVTETSEPKKLDEDENPF
ncbi:hypothetical protein OBBRIDRAFT_558064 [Obba rivulosa]|uniref:Uncharacterized protein n=1 Tax=Obba rivulosa TaxID=1052685 RepID=A0A8E2DK00_9APHY|nr:hypothetical protein OBBRIDRAFT_558064 [Obba rivulosa]